MEPPSGLVAFLFTDVEGSTRLWERDPPAMSEALAAHDRLVEAAIESSGGYTFSRAGDSFAASFPRVSDAVAAAQAIQAALTDMEGTSLALKVRIAIHVGEPQQRDRNYFGSPLNRTARLLAIAWGDQVVLSDVAAKLLEGHDLLNLGEHRLKDLATVEHVWQLCTPGLPMAFPPLRSMSTARHNLPMVATPTIGRDLEIGEVGRLLKEHRLVSLMGPGGGGKTRLALQVAADSIEEFRDGVWFVDLAPVTDPMQALPRVLSEMRVYAEGNRDQTEALVEALTEKTSLLVLDNCEHLVAEVAGLVESLGRCGEGLRILATTRERIRTHEEVVYRVSPLPQPPAGTEPMHLMENPAVQLFVDRAAAVTVGFEPDPLTLLAIAELCRRLDGLPLAIELAAARVRMMSPSELLEHLTDRFRILTGGRRDDTAHHATLHATVDWSYRLLAEPEQILLNCLSVFRGSFDLAAVEALPESMTCGNYALDAVTGLVDKSLLATDLSTDRTRFRILETIRDFAAAKLGDEETERLRRWHADTYADRVLELELARPEAEESYLEGISVDYENVVAALQFTIAAASFELAGKMLAGLRWFWWARTIPEAARQWVDTVIQHSGALEPRTLALVHLTAGTVYLPTDLERAGVHMAASVALLEELVRHDPALAGSYLAARTSHAAQIWYAGDMAASTDYGQANLDEARRLGDTRNVALSLNNLSVAWLAMGDARRAVELAREALSMFEDLGPVSRVIEAKGALGEALWRSGDENGGEALLRDAIDDGTRFGYEPAVLEARQVLAEFLITASRIPEALDLLRTNLQLGQQIILLVGSLGALAEAAVAKGEHELAVVIAAMTRRSCEKSGASPPGLMERLDTVVAEARPHLPAAELDQAESRGRRMTMDELRSLVDRA